MAHTEGGEVLEKDGLIDVVADSADEDSFLGFGAFLHWVSVVQTLFMAMVEGRLAEVLTRVVDERLVEAVSLLKFVYTLVLGNNLQLSSIRARVCFSAVRVRPMLCALIPEMARNSLALPLGVLVRMTLCGLCESASFLWYQLVHLASNAPDTTPNCQRRRAPLGFSSCTVIHLPSCSPFA